MPKSWSFRASMPMRTGPMISRLFRPAAVVETVAAEDVAARARIHVRLAGGFFGGDDGRADFVGDAADVAEVRAASLRHGARHGARLPQREPFAIEGAHDAAAVARLLEVLPLAVELIGPPRDLRHRLLVGLRALRAPRV